MAHNQAKVSFHTCDSVVPIIGDQVEIGVEILNPIQVNAKGIDPDWPKKVFGQHLTFWGGIDNAEVLPKSSPAGVKAEVGRRIEQMGRGGGYVLNAVHNIQPDVPTENIVAMYEHSRTYKPSFSRW